MKKQLLTLAIIIAFAASLQAAVKTTEPIFIPEEVKSLPIEIKTPINKIVNPNFKNIKPALVDLQEAIKEVLDKNLKEVHSKSLKLNKSDLQKIHEATQDLHEIYKLCAHGFEMSILAYEGASIALSEKEYNNLLTLLTDLYNGQSLEKIKPKGLGWDESITGRLFNLVVTFYNRLDEATKIYNHTISSLGSKSKAENNKAKNFILYAIGRIVAYQQVKAGIQPIHMGPGPVIGGSGTNKSDDE